MADVAVLIDIDDPSWLPSQFQVVDAVSVAHPEMGPSVVSIWRQAADVFVEQVHSRTTQCCDGQLNPPLYTRSGSPGG